MSKHNENTPGAHRDGGIESTARMRPSIWLKTTFAILAASFILPGVAAASGFEVPEANPSTDAAPWDPPVVASLREFPFYTDRGFNNGGYVRDAFFSNSNTANNYFEGKKVVKLANGDLVVAAMVKKPNGNQSNGFWNIGLVRYNASGTARQLWANPSPAYSHIEGQYIVYPNSVTATYSSIRDIKAIDGKLVVFANRNYQGGPDIDTDLLVFGEDGSFKSATTPFGSTDWEYSEALETYTEGVLGSLTHHVLALGTRFMPDGRTVFKRFTINAAGVLTDATPDPNAVNVKCTAAGEQCLGRGIALGQPIFLGGAPSIYVMTEFRPNATTTDGSFLVTRVSRNGVKSPTWDPGNINWHMSNGGDRHDWPVGIVVQSSGGASNPVDTIFVTVDIAQSCRDGIAVVRFTSADNGVSATGTRFGGSSAALSLCNILGDIVYSDTAMSMARDGNTIAIAGFRISGNGAVDSTLYALDTNLAMLENRKFPLQIGGPRTHESLLSGITAIGGLKFLATGHAAYIGGTQPPTLVGKTEVAIIQFAPDRIFGGSFGVGAD